MKIGMKAWWINLALREKQILSTGLFFIISLLLYLTFWSPLTHTIESLRKQLSHNQQLLYWMQAADKRIQLSENALRKKSDQHTNKLLLGIIQTQINQSNLVKNLSGLKQTDNNSVQIDFQKVEFDKLINWLTLLWEQQGLIVKQITVTPSKTPGIVAATITVG